MSRISTSRYLSRLGVRTKIVLPLVGLVLILSTAGIAMIRRAETRQQQRHLVDRAAAIAHAIAHVAETASDGGDLQRFLAAMATEPGVDLIVVAAGEPLEVVASTCRPWIGRPVSQLPNPEHTRDDLVRAVQSYGLSMDLHHDQKGTVDYTLPLRTRLRQSHALRWSRGAVMLHFDTSSLRRQQNADTTWMAVALVAAVVLASLAAYGLVRFVVLTPVARLSKVAAAVAHGQRGARVGSRSADELGQLANRFDAMLDELSRREEREMLATREAMELKKQAEAVASELASHKFALDQHSIVAITDCSGVITYVNDKFCEMSRYERDELVGKTHRVINSGHHPESFWADMWRTISEGRVWHGEVCNRSKLGLRYWVDTTIVPFKDGDGTITQHVAIRTDITERKRAEAALAERERQFRTLVHNIPGVSYRCRCDDDWTMLFISEAVTQVTGYPPSDFVDNRVRTYSSVIHPADRRLVAEEVARAVQQRRPFEIEYRVLHANGEFRHVWERGQAVFADETSGEVAYLDGAIFDVTERKQIEVDLVRSARLDKLTGLPNRALLLDRLQRAIDRAAGSRGRQYAVMFLDFDRFKIINDSLGHDVGDLLLQEIAQRLRENIRCDDTVSWDAPGHTASRLGGDEFVVLLNDLKHPDEACAVAQRLLDTFARPHQLEKHEVYSTASIGIVIGDSDYQHADDVLRDADTAMYEAKRGGKARYVVFDASMRQRVQRRMRLETDLRKAIQSDQMYVAYQPVISLSTGLLTGVETLLRWNHPTEGLISPAEFIPLAEESNLIVDLGDWTVTRCGKDFARWRQALGDGAPKTISINWSAKQFVHPELTRKLGQLIDNTGMPRATLQLEIAEEALMRDEEAAIRIMRSIKELGVGLIIDAFGRGHSSLTTLHRYPVDALKTDRKMLVGIDASKDVAALLHALAMLVKNLDITMIATGVEHVGQVVALQELGCDLAQGFFFANPLTADQLLKFAAESRPASWDVSGADVFAHRWSENLDAFEPSDFT